MTGAFSLAVNRNKLWFPEIDDIPVLQKRIAVRIVFSQNRNIPIYRSYRPSLLNRSGKVRLLNFSTKMLMLGNIESNQFFLIEHIFIVIRMLQSNR